MNRIERKQSSNYKYWLLIIASFLTYVILTASKQLYIANKTTLFSLGIFGNLTDLATTFEYYFYSYAIMQICLVFFIKKINVKWFLTLTVGASSILTVLMYFTTNITQHYLIYTANGLLQAGIWGGLFKNLSKYLPKNFLARANGLMTSGPAVAFTLSYVIAALFGENWALPFMVMGITLLASIILYFVSVTAVSKNNEEIDNSNLSNILENEDPLINLVSKKSKITFLIISLVVGASINSVYYVLNNNLDFFLKEVGNFTNSQCKLITIIATIVTVIGPIITVILCEKFRNFLLVGGYMFLLAFAILLPLTLFFETNIVFSIFLFMFFLVITNGVRTLSLSVVALKERSVIDTGVYTTAVNAISSIAAGLAPKGLAIILDNPLLTISQSWRLIFTIILIATITLFIILVTFGYAVNKKKNKA